MAYLFSRAAKGAKRTPKAYKLVVNKKGSTVGRNNKNRYVKYIKGHLVNIAKALFCL